MKTPRSSGVFLNQKEIKSALNTRSLYDSLGNLESLAAAQNVRLEWLPDWPDKHGLYTKRGLETIIWIPPSTPKAEFLCYAHELHHVLFAPTRCACIEMTRTEIARWEGKASGHAALAWMPQLTERSVDGLIREYGDEALAHFRDLHYQKHGW